MTYQYVGSHDKYDIIVVHAAVPAEKRRRARLSVRSVVGRRTRTSESEPVCASDSADGVHFIRSRRERRKEAKRRHPHPDIASSSVCEKIVLSEAAFPSPVCDPRPES